ncbi:MAG: phenylalanine--tRNA ligase subunit beta [Planctomycetota bacterium]|nr:MAG: phenylalanine--tRNA ligase subunit beta [Planctomycetota bacterium]GDY09640.1 phenylalanine--tRNA ligase beta subunit [Planctomycetia bacterium]
MIVSWNWLKDYVALDAAPAEVAERLMMAGLNLESIELHGDDQAIDLEVTSNRPDCLGHIGVAREASVLFNKPLTIPPAAVTSNGQPVEQATSVAIECLDLCPRYVARVIRGVKIGPSPKWLRDRLEAVGIASINNVVDVTNYCLMESGQPFHAFDFDKLRGGRIVVRRPKAGEKIQAIDHNEYSLTPDMCVICDAERPVAVAGVMGGAATEISSSTKNILIEVADFSSMSIRATARKLNLHSPSSYRFERGVDSNQMDWASRRCCELIQQVAGGELLEGAIWAGEPPVAQHPAVSLRPNQFRRILGIDVPTDESHRILTALGLKSTGDQADGARQYLPPSWRRDLSREADLIEEVARIHGYDKIPEDVFVPLSLSQKTLTERVLDRLRDTLTAAGFFETITLSFVSGELAELIPSDNSKLSVDHSSRRQENTLRQSLIPSLLVVRRDNERHGNFNAKLFETASVYLAARPGDPTAEPRCLSFVTGGSFVEAKGVVETLVRRINPQSVVTVRPSDQPHFVPGRGAEVLLNGQSLGWLGELSRDVTDKLDLRDSVIAAELDLATLEASPNLVPTFAELPRYPSISRDLNFVLDETITWDALSEVVRAAAGPSLDALTFGSQYRGQQIPANKKSYVLTVSFRAADRTLTSDEVDAAVKSVIEACSAKLSAALR